MASFWEWQMKGRALWCKPTGIVAMTWHSIYKQPMSIHIAAWVGRLQTTHQHQCLLFMIFMYLVPYTHYLQRPHLTNYCTCRPWKLTFRTGSHGLLQVGIRWVSFWHGLFSGAFAASFREARPVTFAGQSGRRKTLVEPAFFFLNDSWVVQRIEKTGSFLSF